MKIILFFYFFFLCLSDQNPLVPPEDCRELNTMSYEKCGRKTKCGLCTLNIYCGWCLKTGSCVPIDAGNKKTVCAEDCGEVLGFEECYKTSIKRFGEEIEIGGTDFERPQFKPSKYELDYYIVRDLESGSNDQNENGNNNRGNNNSNKNLKIFKQEKFNENPNENPTLRSESKGTNANPDSATSQITHAKNNILGLFDKLLHPKK